MKTFKKNLVYCLCIVSVMAVCFITSSNISYAGDKTTFRFSAYYPGHYPVFKCGWSPWQEMVTNESNGNLVFKNYLNGVLHSAKHGFRALSSGVVDLTTAYPGYQPASFNLSMVNDLPFIFPSVECHIGPLIMENLYAKYFKKEYEKLGVYLGCWVNTSAYNLMSKKPVRSLEELQGMKVRSPSGMCSEFLTALGAVPVMMQSAETYTGLQSGVVDAVLYPDGSSVAYKLYEVAKYSTGLNIMHMGIPYGLNKKFFDSLDPEMQDFIYRKLRQASQMASHAYDIDDIEARKIMLENGVEIITLSDIEMAKIHKAVEPVYEAFIAKNEAKGLPVKELLADIKNLGEKYNKLSYEEAFKLVTENPVRDIITY